MNYINETTLDKHNDNIEREPLNEKTNAETNKQITAFHKKCVNVLKQMTFEPTMLLFIIANVLLITTTQNLCLEKACRVNLNYTHEICSLLKQQHVESENKYEMNVQKLLAEGLVWKAYVTTPLPILIAFFIGSWSDKTGHRKVFVVVPIIGQILMCINSIVNKYFFLELKMEILVFSEAIFEGLTGGWSVCFLTINSFISVITTEKIRTFRLGLINFCFSVGFPIGMAISGFILKKYGVYGGYIISGTIQIINLFYNILFVRDPERTAEQHMHDKKGVFYFFRTFFDWRNVRDTIVVVFKKGPNNRRVRMIIMLLIVTILFGPMFGEISVLYLSTRYRFGWDEVNFSLYQSYNFIMHTIGTIFSITVLSKYLQWHDSVLGIISTISKIAASFVYCFAPNEKIFYLGPLVEILNGTSLLALKSMVSKLVAHNELGKVNSIFALTENLMPLLYVPLYTQIYSATMEVLPGAVFLVGSFMTLPAVVVFILLFIEHRMGLKKKKLSDNDADTPLRVT